MTAEKRVSLIAGAKYVPIPNDKEMEQLFQDFVKRRGDRETPHNVTSFKGDTLWPMVYIHKVQALYGSISLTLSSGRSLAVVYSLCGRSAHCRTC